jgi:hypothetical protein
MIKNQQEEKEMMLQQIKMLESKIKENDKEKEVTCNKQHKLI